MASKDLDILKIDGTNITNDAVLKIGSDNPLVFCCMSCGTIVGDSTDWVTASDKLRAISLVRVTSKVQCGRTLLSSANGDDMGSAYHVLNCEQCKAEFGKMYKTTSSHLDEFRNRFTFNIDKIDSYQVGCGERGLDDNSDLLTMPMACTILSQINKVQSTLTSLEERVSALENPCQSKTTIKDESNAAANDITNIPTIVKSVTNSSALEVFSGDSSSLKRKSQATGLYVVSSPQTLKQCTDECNVAENDITMPTCVDSLRNNSALQVIRAESGSLKRRSHVAGMYLASSPQTLKQSKDECTVAGNDITNVPTSVDSLNNSSALEGFPAESGSLKRRSHAAGLYVASSPKTLKRSKVHK